MPSRRQFVKVLLVNVLRALRELWPPSTLTTMASYLLELQRKLEHADIDWQSTVMAVVLGVGLFEAWIGSASSA